MSMIARIVSCKRIDWIWLAVLILIALISAYVETVELLKNERYAISAKEENVEIAIVFTYVELSRLLASDDWLVSVPLRRCSPDVVLLETRRVSRLILRT